MDSLPLVLLGIRTALKEDTHSTAAEMVYGNTLRLPGEFFTSSSNPSPIDPADYVSRLKAHMQQIRPSQPRSLHRDSHVSDALSLSACTHVFVHADGVRKPRQPPYNGPYLVVTGTDKHFTISIKGRKETVSIDRLKPAHLDATPNTFSDPSPQATVTPTQETPEETSPRVTRSNETGYRARERA